jgi:RimJ/RimL family protein N-acetyltransferase
VLLLVPGGASFFDRRNYPGTDHVVFIATTGSVALPELIRHIPRGERLLFKLMDPGHVARVRGFFSLEQVNAFVSYTAPLDTGFTSSDDVAVSDLPDRACMDIYTAMGHSPDELSKYFQSGQACSFTVYEGSRPLASCFTFPNYRGIHEIAGVYTDPDHRRRGLARKVVETALHHLGHAGQLVRYQAEESNRASLRLAEAIGLRHVVTYEHWRHDPRVKTRM